MRTYAANVGFSGGLGRAFAILTLFFALGGVIAAAAGLPVAPAVPPVLIIGSLLAVGARARDKRRRAALPRSAPTATIRVAAGHVVVDEGEARWRVRRETLAAGWIVPEARGSARVVFAGKRGRTLEAWLPTIAEARELLAELKLGPLERPVTFSFFFGLRVTVGIDGVLVAWPLLGKRRFIRHDALDDVRWTDDRVALVLKDGSRYEIETNARKPAARDAHAGLVDRLCAAREAYAASEGAEPLAALARGGRSRAAWVRELRAMGEASGPQYRSASLPTEMLWRIALDASEKEELRIGATLALRAGLDEEGRGKLRVAAEAAASPRVRVALAAAADEPDDDGVAAALAQRK